MRAPGSQPLAGMHQRHPGVGLGRRLDQEALGRAATGQARPTSRAGKTRVSFTTRRSPGASSVGKIGEAVVRRSRHRLGPASAAAIAPRSAGGSWAMRSGGRSKSKSATRTSVSKRYGFGWPPSRPRDGCCPRPSCSVGLRVKKRARASLECPSPTCEPNCRVASECACAAGSAGDASLRPASTTSPGRSAGHAGRTTGAARPPARRRSSGARRCHGR